MTKDLTVGKPFGVMLRFLIPVCLGLWLQQIYSLVDAVIVGRALGAVAFGGIGATSPINFLVIGFCNGICMGMVIPVAQSFGAGDHTALRRYVANAAYLCTVLSALLLLVVLPACRPILVSMHATPEQFEYSYRYIFVIFCGIPASVFYNFLAGLLRSLGDSRTPVFFLAISSVLNIGLDLLFILVFGLDVAGAALATVLSQGVSALLCFFYARRHYPILHMQPGDTKPVPRIMGRLLGISLPMGLQYSITAIGSILVQSAVNGLGSACVSAHAAANKINHFIIVPYEGLTTASATFAGQNLGAQKFDRIRQGELTGLGIGAIYWGMHIGIVLLFGNLFTSLLLGHSAQGAVTELAFQNMLFYALGGLPLVGVNVTRLAIQGMGFSRLAMCAGMLETAARAFVALALVPAMGYTAACLNGPAAWVLADLFLFPAFILCLRKRRQEASEPDLT